MSEPSAPALAVVPSASSDLLGLLDILILFQETQGQVVLMVPGRKPGGIYLDKGRVVHAALGAQEGEEALLEMLQKPNMSVTLHRFTPPPKPTLYLLISQAITKSRRQAATQQIESSDSEAKGGPMPKAPPPAAGAPSKPLIKSAHLQIVSDNVPAARFELGGTVTRLGRVEGNEVVIPDESISSRHCMLTRADDHILLSDMRSTYGCFVNGEKVQEKRLSGGESLQFGNTHLRLDVEWVGQPPAPASPLLSRQGVQSQLPIGKTADLPKAAPLVYAPAAPAAAEPKPGAVGPVAAPSVLGPKVKAGAPAAAAGSVVKAGSPAVKAAVGPVAVKAAAAPTAVSAPLKVKAPTGTIDPAAYKVPKEKPGWKLWAAIGAVVLGLGLLFYFTKIKSDNLPSATSAAAPAPAAAPATNEPAKPAADTPPS